MPHTVWWKDEVIGNTDLGPLVAASLDVNALLNLRLVCRKCKLTVSCVFLLSEARRLVPMKERLETDYSLELDSYSCATFWKPSVNDTFVMNNELRLMQWARQGSFRVPWSEMTTARAAFYGRTDMIYWMRFEADPPIPMGSKMSKVPHRVDTMGVECEYAAIAGRLEVINWLLKHGFPMTNTTCHEAVRMGHLHILKRFCCVADPYMTWVRYLADEVLHEEIFDFLSNCWPEWSDEREQHPQTWNDQRQAILKEHLTPWVRILEWYIPFATRSERNRIGSVLPIEWFA